MVRFSLVARSALAGLQAFRLSYVALRVLFFSVRPFCFDAEPFDRRTVTLLSHGDSTNSQPRELLEAIRAPHLDLRWTSYVVGRPRARNTPRKKGFTVKEARPMTALMSSVEELCGSVLN